jgi:hypothetical protein
MYVDHTYTGTYNNSTVGRGDANTSGEPFLHVYAAFPSPGYYHLTLYTRKESVAASVAAAAAADHRHSMMHTHTHSRALVYLVKVEDHSLLPAESFAAREKRQQEKHDPFSFSGHKAGSIMIGANGPNGPNGPHGRLNTNCFPTMYSSVSANNVVLVSPVEGVLRAGRTYDFCFYCPIVKAAARSSRPLAERPEAEGDEDEDEDDDYEGEGGSEGGSGDEDEGELEGDGLFLTLGSSRRRVNGYHGTIDGDDGRGQEQGALIAGSTPLRLSVFGEWLEDEFAWSWGHGSRDMGWNEHTEGPVEGMYVTLSGVRIPEPPTADGGDTSVTVFFDREARNATGVTTSHTGLVRWDVLPTENLAKPKQVVAKVQTRRRPSGAEGTQTSATTTTATTTAEVKLHEQSKSKSKRRSAETSNGDDGFVAGDDLGLAVPGFDSRLLLRLEDEKAKVGAYHTLPYPTLPTRRSRASNPPSQQFTWLTYPTTTTTRPLSHNSTHPPTNRESTRRWRQRTTAGRKSSRP